jgi:thiazole synthase
MKVEVNGKSREFVAGGSLLVLLAELEIDPRMVVVERNREIVRRDQLGRVQVEDGDQLEIVHFVGGG